MTIISLKKDKKYAIYSQKTQKVIEYGRLEFVNSSGTTLRFLENGETTTIGKALKQKEFQIVQASNDGGLYCWKKFSSALMLIPDIEEWFEALHLE